MGVEAIALDFVADIGLDLAADVVGSVVTDLGTEFITSSVGDLAFDVASSSLADFGAWDVVGSFAGDADWFNAFSPGDIVGSATTVFEGTGFFPVSPSEFGGFGDFVPAAADVFDTGGFLPVSPSEFGGIGDFVASAGSVFDSGGFIPVSPSEFGAVVSSAGSVADSGFFSSFKLPSLSDIKGVAGQVQSDFSGFIKGAQEAFQAYQKVAPLVNLASSALGIQNPVNQLIQPLGQAVGIAGTVAGVAGTVAGNVSTLNSPSVVSGIGGATGFRELSSAETNILLARAGVSPGLVNYLTDPGTQQPINYNGAVETRDQLTPVLNQFRTQVDTAEQAITQENENIILYRFQLDNPDLTDDQRAAIEARIVTSYDNIAANQEILDNTVPLIQTTTDEIAKAQQIITAANTRALTAAASVVTGIPVDQFRSIYNPTTRTWSVFDTITNSTVQSGLTEQQAILAQQDLNINSGTTLNTSTVTDLGEIVVTASRLPPTEAEVTTEQNAITAGLTAAARDQQAIRSLRNTQAQSSDWRVRLSLAPNSTYLYNDQQPGLLAPLKNTNGVIFPYTPSIETAYKANYDTYDLTHSNYRGYFYKNSYVDAVNLRATFTAQDTNEANYLLAVIHFFRSCTKMFYGQSEQRGAPPPLVYIKGYGDFQFNNHPCLVSQFNYTLPPDVDYIRAQSVLSNNTNLQLARLRSTIANNPLSYSVNRILNSGLLPGALDFRPSTTNNLGIGNPTYVPTKMEISVSLLPIQSRQQVSKNFSVGEFANGNLLRGGFW